MEETREMSLEARLLWPAAALNGHQPQLQTASQAIMEVAVGSRVLTVSPRGMVSGEWFLERLPRAISAATGHQELTVDLSHSTGMDNLALSAMVVMLRNYSNGFRRLVVKGLPPWASQRIENTGARNLLGRHWQGQFGEEEVSFQRC